MIAEPVRVRGSITQETLKLMQRHIDEWGRHPFFVQLARRVADIANATKPEDESWAVWAWVRANVTYRADPVGTQWIQDPYETAVKSKAGNCANMATLAGTMLQALGHPATATAVWWSDRDEWTHAVCLDEKTGRVVDPVSPTFAWPPFGKQVRATMGAA
jgi:transglutaminase-like putative cysteine protease